MRKTNLLLALAASATLLAGCNANKQFFGFGGVAFYDEAARGTHVETTIDYVSVIVDGKGKVKQLRLDTSQVKVSYVEEAYVLNSKLLGEDGDIKSKWDLLDEYGMIVASPIEKEWYEQAAAFEAWTVGKTLKQIKAAIDTEKNELIDGVAVGVTVTVDTWVGALENALDNKVEINGEVAGLGVGSLNTWDRTHTGNDFYIGGAVFDKDHKVLGARVDTFQLQYTNAEGRAIIDKAEAKVQVVASENRIRGKHEQKEDYGMIVASPIEKEWYEQANALATYVVGKTVSAALGSAAELENGETVGVTMKIAGYRSVLLEAEHTAFNARIPA